jgi:Secretion system C-terminal sorting domain
MRTKRCMRGFVILLLIISSYDLSLSPAFAQGFSWTRTDSSVSTKVGRIAVGDSSRVFVGAGWAMYSSTNSGDNWTWLLNLGTTTGMIFGPDSILYVSTNGPAVLFSTDRGLTWQASTPPTAWPLYAIFLDVQGRLLAGGMGGSENFHGGLFRSPTHSWSWSHLYISSPWEPTINAILVTRDGTILVNGFRSTDDGGTWSTVGPPSNTTSFALGAGNSLIAGTTSGIYLSDDDGASWVPSVPGLPGTPVNCLIQNRTRVFFAGTSGGVCSSNDGGFTWTAINDGLTQLNVHALALDSTGYLYAGTDVGVFRSTQSTTSVDKELDPKPSTFSLRQNYPNPFNPSTTIRYGLPSESHVTLTVYNTLGQKVTELVNGEMHAGYHEVRFDGTNLTSGVYFYRLQAGNFVATKKLLFLR